MGGFKIKHYEQNIIISALFLGRNYRHEWSIFVGSLELHDAVCEGVQRVVLTHTDILAGIVNSTSLANDDVASFGELSTEDFQT